MDESAENSYGRNRHCSLTEPPARQSPERAVWLAYDAEADTLSINFQKPTVADDSELTDDDIIIRYRQEEVIGITVLHASRERVSP